MGVGVEDVVDEVGLACVAASVLLVGVFVVPPQAVSTSAVAASATIALMPEKRSAIRCPHNR